MGTEILNFSIVKLYLNSDKLINLQTLWEREKSNEFVNFYAAISAQETKKQKQTKNKQTKSFTDLNRETVVYCEIKIKKQNNAKQKTKKQKEKQNKTKNKTKIGNNRKSGHAEKKTK